jgi:hypothetical protein
MPFNLIQLETFRRLALAFAAVVRAGCTQTASSAIDAVDAC